MLKHAKRHRVPLRLYSNANRPSRFGLAAFSSGLRDSACMPVFSSMHKTGSPLGAWTYNATID
jgi:hypothetical protein